MELSLGLEEEFRLVGLQSRRLVARAPEVLGRLPHGGYAAELERCVVETNTDVVSGLDALRADVQGRWPTTSSWPESS